jgi:predicted neuraminidase
MQQTPQRLSAIICAILIANIAAGAESPPGGPQPGVIDSELIFSEAPFRSCHASTVAETPKGLVASYFAGSREGSPDVGIWVSRQVNGKWTNPVEVADGIQSASLRYACWNPVLFQPKQGPLLLFYKVGPNPGAWWGMMTTSTDQGETWSTPMRLPKDILGPIKNKPVQLDNGTIVCPSSTEDHGWRLHFEMTPDLGKNWSRTEPLNDGTEIGAIQPTILRYEKKWQLLARDRHKVGHIWSAGSRDSGKTWSKLEPTELPNPSSGIDAVSLADGRQLLVYNHTQRKSELADSGGSRSKLNIALSDDGKAWQAALVLEDSPGEYSYPAVIQTSDGLVHVTYTWQRKRIKHVVVEPTKLRSEPIRNGEWPEGIVRGNY